MSRGAARRSLAAALLPLLLVVAGAARAQEPEAPDVPSGPATLRGRVVESTTGAPVAGAPVVLYALSRDGVPGLRRATTDAEGAFVFSGVSNASDVAYLVGARHEEVPYPGERVVFDGATEQRVEIRVAPVRRDPAAVRLVERRLRLEASGGRLGVSETLVIENAGEATVYVPEGARAEARPALRLALPRDLEAFRMPLGVVPEGVVPEAGSVTFWGPVYPGRQELGWSYALGASPGDEAAPDAPRAERFEWRAAVGTDAAPVVVELPAGATRLEAPGAALEELPTDGEDAELRRLAVRPPADGPLVLAVQTPPARVAPDAVRPVEVRLVLHADAAAVEVNETHTLGVEGDQRVRSGPDQPLHRIVLPERLADLRFGSDAPDVALQPGDDGSLVVTGSLPPGESRVELAYRLPVEGLPTTVARRFPQRVPLLSVFLAETGETYARSERMHRRRPVRTQDLTYAHFEAFEVEADQPVRLEIAPLPARGGLPQAAWLALGGGLAVAAIAFVLGPVWRARSAGRLEPEEAESPAERERQALYDAIRDLDHDFETGKISEEDHARTREELRARAVASLARAQAAARGSAPAAPTPPAPVPCSGCGAEPRPGDRFCARCGTGLPAADAAPAGGPPTA